MEPGAATTKGRVATTKGELAGSTVEENRGTADLKGITTEGFAALSLSPPAHAGAARTSTPLRLLTLAALTGVLLGLCVLLALPFLPAITWGVALAILAWPLHRGISRRVARPGLAALVSTSTVVGLLLVPGLFVTYQLAREAGAAAAQVQGVVAGGDLRATLASVTP